MTLYFGINCFVIGCKRALLISDSIGKHVSGVDELVVAPFPGRTIGGLSFEVTRNLKLKHAIESADMVIVHAGTNDIHKLSVDEFPAVLNNLFASIHLVKPTVKLLYSGILPRPVDFKETQFMVIRANNRIRQFCKFRKYTFLRSFKPFVQEKW